MGTRADFYVGKGKEAKWIGSIAYDGHTPDVDDKGELRSGGIVTLDLLGSKTAKDYRNRVKELLNSENHSTSPEQGWPWPWQDSRTTDVAYTYDKGKVYASLFGHPWFNPLEKRTDQEWEAYWDLPKMEDFPNMLDKQNVTLGPRSGLLVISVK